MSLLRSRWFGVAVLIAVIALVAVTAISYFTARELVEHRGAYVSAITPADSGMRYQTIPLRARDGTLLEGWWIPPSSDNRRPDLAVVVLAHAEDGPWTRPSVPGSRPISGKARMVRHAAWLHRAGFIVLAFDFRSYGGSEGFKTSGGYLEQQDLEAAVSLAHERAVGAPVAVLGEGMGATVALAVAARDTSIVAVVADSPNTTWMEGMARVDSVGRGVPWMVASVPPLVAAGVSSELRGRQSAGAQIAIESADQLKGRPVLVIHGEHDRSPSHGPKGGFSRALGRARVRAIWGEVVGADRFGAYGISPARYQDNTRIWLARAIKK